MSHKSFLQECPTRVSHKSVLQECRVRVSHKSVLQVTHKSVLQECLTRVSHKSVLQECPTRVPYKSVPQECPTRVSYKSVPQEFPTRVSYKSVLQESPRRVSHKSVPQECHLDICVFRTCLHSGSWVPSDSPKRVSHKSVIWTYVFFERVCIRVRGFHLVFYWRRIAFQQEGMLINHHVCFSKPLFLAQRIVDVSRQYFRETQYKGERSVKVLCPKTCSQKNHNGLRERRKRVILTNGPSTTIWVCPNTGNSQ